jgi:ribonuclease BN (tRNA processing enzyme)
MPALSHAAGKYGGHTTCFSVHTNIGLLIIDAGTGITTITKESLAIPPSKPIFFLFTHFHIDHVMGLPYFDPLYEADARVCFLGNRSRQGTWQRSLRTWAGPPYWPTDIDRVPADISFEDVDGDDEALAICGLNIAWCSLSHPQGCLAYRIESPAGSIVVATDHEAGNRIPDRELVALSRNADILLHDAFFTVEEAPLHKGWGHSTWRDAVQCAQEAGVKQLVLTHHHPSRSDYSLDAIQEQARQAFPNTTMAREGMMLFA